MPDRMTAQFAFLEEAEKLREIERQNLIIDGSRTENSAEHSWHLALYAFVLAPFAGPDVDISRVMKMLLLHDLVEIDAGDHPIADDIDWAAVAQAELAAAKRLFGLLPTDQGQQMMALWQEFEAAETPDAQFGKALDHCQPIFQTLYNPDAPKTHVDIVRDNLTTGRASHLKNSLPAAHSLAMTLLGQTTGIDHGAFETGIRFLVEADRLKLVERASRLTNGSRHENSAEHSWHIMLFGWVLAEYSHATVDTDTVLQMLLLHDLVEIDAGDTPIHGTQDPDELTRIAQAEAAAAKRIFGLLPARQGEAMRALWDEFEAAQSNNAIFAKSIDRVQPLLLNLANGGGSWVEYNVTFEQLQSRVGVKVAKGAPQVWDHMKARTEPWFTNRLQTAG